MSVRSTHIHAPASESGVGRATAVALGASGMDTGSTWHDLEAAPTPPAAAASGRAPWWNLGARLRA